MSIHSATIRWEREGDTFAHEHYHRSHIWSFDGGVEVRASASPAVVPMRASDEAAVDPEEAFVAALSSCHMLWFLSIAQRRGFVVDRYEDAARGFMTRNGEGKFAITAVVLAPRVAFDGENPNQDIFLAMHAQAHRECFLAASVRAEIRCTPVMAS